MENPNPRSTTYTLTEDQFYRLNRARSSIQIMASLLVDAGDCARISRKVSDVLELTSDDMDTLITAVEGTAHG